MAIAAVHDKGVYLGLGKFVHNNGRFKITEFEISN